MACLFCQATRGAPFVPVGLDDAVFLQPVSIGDMVRWVARVVHSGDDGIFRVQCVAAA